MQTKKITPRKAKSVHYLDFEPSMLSDDNLINDLKKGIDDLDVFIIRNIVDSKVLDQITSYLTNIGKSSIPSYHFLKEGCPDFHRVHQFDERSYVKGMMHQFMFHPWNQNIFDLFSIMNPVYRLKNILGGLDEDAYLTTTPDDGFIARLSFQFYPKGGGCIKKHSDPVDVHQTTLPVITMSEFGKDFKEGGAYVIGEDGEKLYTDPLMSKGDVIFFNAEITHGVAPIDPDENLDWFAYQGRWMCLVSVIKTLNNSDTPNSLQLEP